MDDNRFVEENSAEESDVENDVEENEEEEENKRWAEHIACENGRYAGVSDKRAAVEAEERAAIEEARARGLRIAIVGNETAIDLESGLMWSTCAGSVDDLDWDDAHTYCELYRAGLYDDWFLPEIDALEELYEALEEDGKKGGGDLGVFARVWSCDGTGNNEALTFNFATGRRYPVDLWIDPTWGDLSRDHEDTWVLPVRWYKKTE